MIKPDRKILKALEKTKHIHFWHGDHVALYDMTEEECLDYRDDYENNPDEEWPEPLVECGDSVGYSIDIVIALAAKAGITVESQ